LVFLADDRYSPSSVSSFGRLLPDSPVVPKTLPPQRLVGLWRPPLCFTITSSGKLLATIVCYKVGPVSLICVKYAALPSYAVQVRVSGVCRELWTIRKITGHLPANRDDFRKVGRNLPRLRSLGGSEEVIVIVCLLGPWLDSRGEAAGHGLCRLFWP
jgi:hypothetical protein